MTTGVRRVGFASRSGITGDRDPGSGRGWTASRGRAPGCPRRRARPTATAPTSATASRIGLVEAVPRRSRRACGGRLVDARDDVEAAHVVPAVGARRRAGTAPCTCRSALSMATIRGVRLVVGVDRSRSAGPCRGRRPPASRPAPGAGACRPGRPASQPSLLPRDEADELAALGDEHVAVDVHRAHLGRRPGPSPASGRARPGKPPPSAAGEYAQDLLLGRVDDVQVVEVASRRRAGTCRCP